MIPFEELKIGTVYKLNSRNLALGVFTADKGFIGIRTKFGNRFLDQEYEWCTDDNYGTARAIEDIGKINDIELVISLGTRCPKCSQTVNFDINREVKSRWHHDDDTVMCEGAIPTSIGNKELFLALERFEAVQLLGKGEQK